VIKTDTPAKHRGTNYGTGTKMWGVIMLKFILKPSNSCSGSNNKGKTDKLSCHPYTLSAQNKLFIYTGTPYGKRKFPVIYCVLMLGSQPLFHLCCNHKLLFKAMCGDVRWGLQQ
jgi:hypothetical protein